MAKGSIDPQYAHMNAGAQRRPPPQIAAPALALQWGYWRPKSPATDLNDGQAIGDVDHPDAAWHHNIDNMLAHLFRYVCLSSASPDYASPNYDREKDILYLFDHKIIGLTNRHFHLRVLTEQEKSVRHGIFTIRTTYSGVGLVISARRHAEYFIIMLALEFPDHDEEKVSKDHFIRSMSRHLGELHDLIIERHVEFHNSRARPGPFDERFDKDFENANSLNEGILISVVGFADRFLKLAASNEYNDRPNSIDHCGSLFANFIGIIYSLKFSDGGDSLGRANHPLDQGTLRRSEQVTGTDFIEGDLAPRVLDAAWPVVTSAGCDPSSDVCYGEPERVVSAFNRGRTLYISSLGHLTPEKSSHSDPLIYTLLVSYPSRWRLGRFIDRLNLLGILRLAALRDLREINDASNVIDRISRTVLREGFNPDQSFDARYARSELAGIGKELEFGLRHRIERSRYYVSSYKEIVDSLGARPVQGFHFYPTFVRNRLYDAFDYIDRVGRRYDGLLREVDLRATLSQRQQTQDLQEAISKQTRTVTRLLEAAEVLGIIPLTYYAGTLLQQTLHEEKAYYFLFGFVFSIALAVSSWSLRNKKLPRLPWRRQKRNEEASVETLS